MIEKCFVLPHPPIIMPEIGRGEEHMIARTRASMERAAAEIAALKPDTVVLSSPHAPFYRDGFFIAGGQRARGDFSPFGFPEIQMDLALDLELSTEIARLADEEGIANVRSRGSAKLDHGTLVPLRFVEQAYADFQLVLLGLSMLPAREHYRLGVCVQKAARALGRRAVFIASGDLSHVLKKDGPYGFREEGPAFDGLLTDILSRAAFGELLSMPQGLSEKAAQCGLPSFQIMAGTLDGYAVEAEHYSYEGPFGVGYGIFAFQPAEADAARQFLRGTDPDEAKMYLELARTGICYYLRFQRPPEVPRGLPEYFYSMRAGCFVSLHKRGQLRGCIGTMGATRDSLAEEIIMNAIAAATSDPRFPALRPEELDELELSVDVLGELERIPSTSFLDPQRYGVYVVSGRRSGVLLPRLETVDTVEEQLAIAMSKAGISPREEIDLYRFEVRRYE